MYRNIPGHVCAGRHSDAHPRASAVKAADTAPCRFYPLSSCAMSPHYPASSHSLSLQIPLPHLLGAHHIPVCPPVCRHSAIPASYTPLIESDSQSHVPARLRAVKYPSLLSSIPPPLLLPAPHLPLYRNSHRTPHSVSSHAGAASLSLPCPSPAYARHWSSPSGTGGQRPQGSSVSYLSTCISSFIITCLNQFFKPLFPQFLTIK